MKIFTDGSLIGRTAAMSAPYDGEPHDGQPGAAELTATIVAAHAIGDPRGIASSISRPLVRIR